MNGSLPAALVVALLVVALLVAFLALALTVVALRRSRPRRRASRVDVASLPVDVAGLRGEVQALRTEVGEALRHLAVVRYDAFGDMGGHLSWSLALLDDGGNGIVLTSIHGRSEARTYAKNITGWSCDQALSPEEDEALKFAQSA